ncbi:MAG: VOC family protein [Cellulomonas sp.]|nr:VOC family protein [Cellulomonas sp.]
MSIHTDPWPEGTPAWVDLMVPDRHVAQAFYGPLLGWEFDEGRPETGYYSTARRGGRAAAGVGELMPGSRAGWTTYLAVDDVDATAKRVTAAGGTLLAEPMDVMDLGRMAVLADPTGAIVGLWQSGLHTGADVVNEPGAQIWNELMTRDFAAAKKFYGAVFPYTFGDMSGPGFTYATLDLDGRPVGGIGELGAETPADEQPAWSTYFAVSDTDAATARAVELGGQVVSPPADSPYGRLAVLRGPSGETFALMSTTDPSSPQA